MISLAVLSSGRTVSLQVSTYQKQITHGMTEYMRHFWHPVLASLHMVALCTLRAIVLILCQL